MRVGSLFSGCGLLDLAFERAGFTVAWQCECDPQARRVLAHHWPTVPCYPDVRTLDPASLAPVDVLVGGFPCQDLSVAGKRQGLAGERSGLFYALTKVAYVLQPKFLVWENVPGLLSSDCGRDFARVLLELERIGFHGSWTVLDAQWFGVPQRRRRLFGVFTRRDIAPECTAEILALTARRRRDPPQSPKARPDVAAALRSRSASAGVHPPGRGGEDDCNLIAATLNNGDHQGGFRTEPGEHLICPEQAYCLPASARGTGDGHGQGWNSNYVVAGGQTARYGKGTDSDACDAMVYSTSGKGWWNEGPGTLRADAGGMEQSGHLVAHTLRAEGCDASEDGTGRGTPLVAIQDGRAMNKQQNGLGIVESAPSFTLDGTGAQSVFAGTSVRRLTPVECLRLQGAPDDYLDLEPPLSDSAKYRLIGNAVAVPVVEWIARRLRENLD